LVCWRWQDPAVNPRARAKPSPAGTNKTKETVQTKPLAAASNLTSIRLQNPSRLPSASALANNSANIYNKHINVRVYL
jgi:uncharacterized protein YkwD